MSTFDPNALECLAAIVEEGGFERAAVRLVAACLQVWGHQKGQKMYKQAIDECIWTEGLVF